MRNFNILGMCIFISILLVPAVLASDLNISGYVLDGINQSKVIPSTTVTLWNTTSNNVIMTQAISNASGYYNVTGECAAAPNNYTLQYIAVNYEESNYSLTLRGTRRNPACPHIKLDFNKTMVPDAIATSHINGTLLINGSTQPISNDTIVFLIRNNTVILITSTDNYGFYSLSVAPGDYTLEFSKTHFYIESFAFNTSDGSAVTFDYNLTEKAYISGNVSASGSPLSSATVLDSNTTVTAYSDSYGYYAMSSTAGNHSVTASKSGYYSQTKTINLSSSLFGLLDFVLSAVTIPPAVVPPRIPGGGGGGGGIGRYNITGPPLTIPPEVPPTVVRPPQARAPAVILNKDISVKITGMPESISFDMKEFKIRAHIKNIGEQEIHDVTILARLPWGWKSDSVMLPILAVGEETDVEITVTSPVCSNPGKITYLEKNIIPVSIEAVNNIVRSSEKTVFTVEVPELGVAQCSEENFIILVNNLGYEARPKTEFEIQINDQDNGIIFLDYLTPYNIDADKIFILNRNLNIRNIPLTQLYTMKVSMYEDGMIFTDNYPSAKTQSHVSLQENIPLNHVTGQVII